jgi:membrane protein DedA with SNARE-associated domain
VVDFDYFRDLVIAFTMFVTAGLGAPFPEEILIVGAGVWTAAHAEYGLFRWLMLPVCVVGVIIADCLLYGIGRAFGPALLKRRWMQRMIPPDKLQRIETNYDQYGVGILLFGRLVPGIRAPLFVTAGIMRLSIPRFLMSDGIGAVLGNSLLYFLAFWFGDSVLEAVKLAETKVYHFRPFIIMGGVILVSAYLLYRFLRRPVPEGDLKKEVPIIGPQVAAHMDQSDSIKKKASGLLPGANGEVRGDVRVKNSEGKVGNPGERGM